MLTIVVGNFTRSIQTIFAVTAFGGTVSGMPKYFYDLHPDPKPKKPTYNMTMDQLEEMSRKARLEGIKIGIYYCNAMYSAAMLQGIRDVLGYGQKRLKRMFDRVQFLFNQISAGEISYKDIADALMDECKVNIIIERPDGLPQNAEDVFRELEKQQYLIKLRKGR